MTNSLANVSGDNAALPAVYAEFEEFSGAGLENVTARDLLIPRLAIVQALSDEVKPKHGKYIPGAQIGDIVDTGTGEICPNPLPVIVCHYGKVWMEWWPRNTGKGLVAIHPDDTIIAKCHKDEKKRLVTPDGTFIEETAQFYVLNLALQRRSFIAMKSTQLKNAKKLVTLATSEKLKGKDGREFTPPLWYRVYNLSSVDENNNEGDWKGWKPTRGPAIHELPDWQDIKAAAIEFREAVTSGLVHGDVSSDHPTEDVM